MLTQRRPTLVSQPPRVSNIPANSGQRFWWLDSLRGFLVVLMVSFHFFYDLAWMNIWGTLHGTHFWWYGGGVIGGGFLSVAGISMGLRSFNSPLTMLRRKYLKRGVQLLAVGGGITLLSLVVSPQSPIWFGILHCLGLSTLVGIAMLKKSPLNILVLALSLLMLSYITHHQVYQIPFLNFLGLGSYPPVAQGDYFPVLPWTGAFLLGMALGSTFILQEKMRMLNFISTSFPFKGLVFLGRNSLSIYLLHQPILLGTLYLGKKQGLM